MWYWPARAGAPAIFFFFLLATWLYFPSSTLQFLCWSSSFHLPLVGCPPWFPHSWQHSSYSPHPIPTPPINSPSPPPGTLMPSLLSPPHTDTLPPLPPTLSSSIWTVYPNHYSTVMFMVTLVHYGLIQITTSVYGLKRYKFEIICLGCNGLKSN